mmetsp:Transcript_31969/g.88344  ORF Transcript_31969/g.88344 Transcript_31969/m.88344 type:complete len:201 (-) Transcript_31969:150-752(-)
MLEIDGMKHFSEHLVRATELLQDPAPEMGQTPHREQARVQMQRHEISDLDRGAVAGVQRREDGCPVLFGGFLHPIRNFPAIGFIRLVVFGLLPKKCLELFQHDRLIGGVSTHRLESTRKGLEAGKQRYPQVVEDLWGSSRVAIAPEEAHVAQRDLPVVVTIKEVEIRDDFVARQAMGSELVLEGVVRQAVRLTSRPMHHR